MASRGCSRLAIACAVVAWDGSAIWPSISHAKVGMANLSHFLAYWLLVVLCPWPDALPGGSFLKGMAVLKACSRKRFALVLHLSQHQLWLCLWPPKGQVALNRYASGFAAWFMQLMHISCLGIALSPALGVASAFASPSQPQLAAPVMDRPQAPLPYRSLQPACGAVLTTYRVRRLSDDLRTSCRANRQQPEFASPAAPGVGDALTLDVQAARLQELPSRPLDSSMGRRNNRVELKHGQKAAFAAVKLPIE